MAKNGGVEQLIENVNSIYQNRGEFNSQNWWDIFDKPDGYYHIDGIYLGFNGSWINDRVWGLMSKRSLGSDVFIEVKDGTQNNTYTINSIVWNAPGTINVNGHWCFQWNVLKGF